MKAELLHVIGAYYNFRRAKTPRRLFHEWIEYQLDSGVSLTIVEFALGERPYELDPRDPKFSHVRILQVRGRPEHEFWIRDALVNWGIAHLPDNAKYVCWDDTDVKHSRLDWAVETVHMLQQYRAGETWSPGSSDWHMAYAFAGYLGDPDPRMTPGYARRLREFTASATFISNRILGVCRVQFCILGMAGKKTANI